MTRITELEEEIRGLINSPRKHRAVLEDSGEYHKLCSCLDVIGDTELAFRAYAELSDGLPHGTSYILAYGFLQALFLQQDAVRHLCEALQLPWKPDSLLDEIREVRNDSIGHPTNRRGGKSFSFISRPSISKSGFQLMTVESATDRPPMFRYVRFQSLLDIQHARLETVLDALLQALRKEEMEHRQQFRDEKLVTLFPRAMSYYFEKVYEAVRGRAWENGTILVARIREIVEGFKAALERRQIAGAYESVEYQVERLDYPLTQLGEFFAKKGEGRLEPEDAEIFTFFVRSEMSKLRKMAGEIDDEYASKP